MEKLCNYYPNIDLNILYNNDGWSPIHVACNSGNVSFLQYIVNNYNGFKIDCNISIKNEMKYTPAIFATANPNIQLLKFLINNGVLLEKCDNNGNLPIHYAIITQSFPIINLILDESNELMVNMANNYGDTPIILGFKRKIETIVLDKLILSNANLIHFNNVNYTALHWLFLRGDVTTLKYLNEKVNLIDYISQIEMISKSFKTSSLLHCLIQSEVIICLKFVFSIYSKFECTFDLYGR